MQDHAALTTVALIASALLTWLAASAGEQPAKAASFPDTISPAARKYLESLADPATLPLWPAPDDVAGWKKAWEAGEASSESSVQAALKRYRPTVKECKLGGVPVLDIKPKDWTDSAKVLVHAHGGAYTMFSARSRLVGS